MLFFIVPNTMVNMIGFALYIMLLTNRSAVPIPPLPVKAMTMVAIFGGLELLFGLFFRTGVAHFAHLGGMLGGWLMILYWRGRLPFGRRR
jgi:membrane associated rhomboid family serine protease